MQEKNYYKGIKEVSFQVLRNSVSTLDELATTENLGTINKTQIIIEEFNKIEQAIGQPVIDFQRWFW
jgi:hypothetical protein